MRVSFPRWPYFYFLLVVHYDPSPAVAPFRRLNLITPVFRSEASAPPKRVRTSVRLSLRTCLTVPSRHASGPQLREYNMLMPFVQV